MAAIMKPCVRWQIVVACVAALAHGHVQAQVVADPTRPPADLQSAASGSDGTAASPMLQSIMISSSERSAIINGERVKQGGSYGNSRVLKISENEVVLRTATGAETLRLYPGVDMKPVKAAVPESKSAPKPRAVRKASSNSTESQGKP